MTLARTSPGSSGTAELLFSLTRSVAAASGLDDIFEAALACLQDALGVERSAVLLFDEHGTMRFAASRGLSPAYRAAVDGHSPWTADTADPEPITVPDVGVDEPLAPFREAILAEGIRALAFVPLVASGRLLGKFMIYDRAPRTFTGSELMVASTIAAQVAFAVEQERAREVRAHASALLAGQKRTLELLLDGAPLPIVLQSVAALVNELSDGDAATSILLLDGEGRLREGASPGFPAEYIAAIDGLPAEPGVGTCAEAAATGEVVITVDIASDPSWEGLRHLPLGLGFVAAWSQPIRARNGEVLGTLGTYFRERRGPRTRERDVVEVLASTAALAIERTRDDNARYDQQAHLDALFRSSVAGVAEIDSEGRLRLVNDRFCDLAGRSREELLAGMTVYEVTHPEDHHETERKLEALHEGRGDFTVEKRMCTPEGRETWVASCASAVRSREGDLTGALLVVLDISEQKRADGVLRQREAQYRTLVESLGVAVYTTDAEGRILLYNDVAAELWGRRPEIGVDRWSGTWRMYELDGHTPIPAEECPTAIAIKEDRLVRGVEIVVERPDGSRCIALPYPTPIHDETGRVAGAVSVHVDVTQQRQTQDALQRALRAKDDFLGLVSHELKTPLTAISGNSRSLLLHGEQLDNETRTQALADIVEEGDRLQHLVENMLVLSRMADGRDIDLEPILVQRVVPRLLRRFQRRMPGREVVIDVPDALPPVIGAASYVDQVISNLVSNADKYSPPGLPITITARTGKGEVEVRICDRGTGVPEDEQRFLFTPFFRSDQARNMAQGAGLGLAVCRRLAEAQGGRAWFEERDGGGSVFAFALRMA